MPGAPGTAPADPAISLGPMRLSRALAQRLGIGIVAAPVLVGLVLAGTEAVAAGLAVILAVAVHEMARAMGLGLRDPIAWLAAAGAAAMAAVAATPDIPTIWVLTPAVLAILATPVIEEALRPGIDFAQAVHRISVGLVALVYLGWLGSFAVLLRDLPSGDEWLLLAMLVVMSADTGAFTAGKLIGRRQLAPRISPAKTVEGALGGMVGGYAAVTVLALIFGLRDDAGISYGALAALGLVLPLLAQVGDLTESVLKRGLGVKDFSHLIPGHGGLLDRLDSMVFGIPAVYFFLQWFVL